MIEFGSLRITYLYIILLSIFFSVLSFARIPYQIYLWEIFIDGKIIAMVLFLIYLQKSSKFQFSYIVIKLKRLNWQRCILWLLFPIAVYSIVVFIGIVLNEGAFDKFDNIVTMILATLFDLPAVFVFSLTFIFIEEIIFRGILLNSHHSKKHQTASVITVSVLCSVFSMADVFTNDFSSSLIYASLLFYFFSISLISSFLALRYNSLWVSYSFRIGLLTIAPLILTSYLVESDSLFQTKNSFFYAEGFLFSLLTLVVGFILLKRRAEIPLESQIVKKSTI